MPEIIFSHPDISHTLSVETGANNFTWAYNLNTIAYPTYAGEVVQVLSVNIDNLILEGEVKSYAKMEQIYRWFLLYMQKATQGHGGDAYVEYPVKMEYPHRGWTMWIKPITLPALRYGRDVVVPTWQLQAHIDDPDPEQRELTINHAMDGSVENWRNRVSANIGFRQANPFSDPLAVLTKEEAKLYPRAVDIAGLKVEGSGDPMQSDLRDALSGLAKQMQTMFDSLLQGAYKDIIEANESSGPSKSATNGGKTKKP
jgi:hypothetical protein